jgi:hypothetical protein
MITDQKVEGLNESMKTALTVLMRKNKIILKKTAKYHFLA